MTDRRTRNLLSETDKEFEKAKFSLFKASIYLEEIDEQAFKKTLDEIKQTIKDLGSASESLIDFINAKDFPKTTDEIKDPCSGCANTLESPPLFDCESCGKNKMSTDE